MGDPNNTFPFFPVFPRHSIRSLLINSVRKFLQAPNYPSSPFQPTNTPPAPNYTDPEGWYSCPSSFSSSFSSSSPSSPSSPSSLSSSQESEHLPPGSSFVPEKQRPAECFFLHPTSYWGRRWNQDCVGLTDSEDQAAAEITKYWTLSTQASVFNESCRVWSPKYRQCTIVGLDNEDARSVAYEDCRRAFYQFLSSIDDDAPIILAGHSQGGYHLGRLLEDIVDKDPILIKRLVCAYLVGARYPMAAFGKRLLHLRVGTSSNQTSCVVGWDTVTTETNMLTRMMIPTHETMQISPITWTREEEKIQGNDSRWHGGVTVSLERKGEATTTAPTWNEFFGTDIQGLVTIGLVDIGDEEVRAKFWSQCDPVLGIIVPEMERKHLGPCAAVNWLLSGWYHCEDYSLFWYNIRENVKERVDAHIAARMDEKERDEKQRKQRKQRIGTHSKL